MSQIIHFVDNQVAIEHTFFQTQYYLLTFGVLQSQGSEYSPSYLSIGEYDYHIFEIKIEPTVTKLRNVTTKRPEWRGVPFELNNVNDKTIITEWLTFYSKYILMEIYNIELESNNSISSEYNNSKLLLKQNRIIGVQLRGFIKLGEFSDLSNYSANIVVNLIQLPQNPMISRIGDRRIGYFYQELLDKKSDPIYHEPYVIINRRNIKTTPWIYLIDPSIPEKFIDATIKGVEHWNKYFNSIGHGKPFMAIMGDQKKFDIFNPEYNYVVNHSKLGLNSDYTGYSQDFVDFRSGEILFGNIYINYDRVESIGRRYFDLYQDYVTDDSLISSAINNCLIWIIGHEIGHQLGLRHNFVGNELNDGYGSIMDYIEFFDNYHKFIKQNYDIIRSYDLHAITYGYIDIPNEQHGIKSKLLDEIAKIELPFKTDDHIVNDNLPNVGKIEDESNILNFIEKSIDNYRQFRLSILNKIKTNAISSYHYSNGFLFIYINRYCLLIKMLCRYIGGRKIDFHYYQQIDKLDHLNSLMLLLRIKQDLKYLDSEYQYLIYDFPTDLNQLTPIVKVNDDPYLYYGFNTNDLFIVFQNLTNLYLVNLTKENNIIRLNSGKYQYSYDLLYQFTFCTSQTNNIFNLQTVDGIFPEIGLIIIGEDRSNIKNKLNKMDIFDQYTQYQWINLLLKLRNENHHYFIQMIIENIFATIKKYRKSIKKNIQGLTLTHYKLIWKMIDQD